MPARWSGVTTLIVRCRALYRLLYNDAELSFGDRLQPRLRPTLSSHTVKCGMPLPLSSSTWLAEIPSA